MINLLINLFLVSFLINLVYELSHSFLYKTCLEASFKKYTYLILKGALFDGFVITIIYYFSFLIFKTEHIFQNHLQLTFFIIIALLIAYFWEVYSLKAKKWEYSNNMPLVLDVGLTPFIQLALTGILSLYLVFQY